MEILIGFGVLLGIAWFSMLLILEHRERSNLYDAPIWLWWVALTPWIFAAIAALTLIAWLLGTLVTGGFSG